eukprot:4152860-Pleurochrysis_carterae.AAC.2
MSVLRARITTCPKLLRFIYSPDSFDSELTFAKTANLALEMASSTQVRAVELTSSMGSAVSETYAKSYASTIHAAAAVAAASKKISMEMRFRAGAATDVVFSVSEALKENLSTHADAALDVYTAVAQRAYERLAEAVCCCARACMCHTILHDCPSFLSFTIDDASVL